MTVKQILGVVLFVLATAVATDRAQTCPWDLHTAAPSGVVLTQAAD